MLFDTFYVPLWVYVKYILPHVARICLLNDRLLRKVDLSGFQRLGYAELYKLS